ncbi:MAG: hypothetical protein ACJ71T_11875 [Actinomycetales bacterium]
MPARTFAAVLAALALVGLAACSSGSDPAKTPTPSSTAVVTPSPTTSQATVSAQDAAAAKIRSALTKAQLTTAQVKLVRQKESVAESRGLSVRTFIACGYTKVDPSDFARVDRLQSSWLSKGWASQDPTKAQVKVSSEVVAYRPGGVAAAMKSYQGAPKACPKTRFTKGVTGTVKAAKAPAGLPKGSVVLSQVIRYKNNVTTTGYIVAIPAGNVLGLLYVDGVSSDPKAVVTNRTRILPTFVTHVVAAGVAVGTLTATAAGA